MITVYVGQSAVRNILNLFNILSSTMEVDNIAKTLFIKHGYKLLDSLHPFFFDEERYYSTIRHCNFH